jgi:hypothetical protein
MGSGSSSSSSGTDYGPVVEWVVALVPDFLTERDTWSQTTYNPYDVAFGHTSRHAYDPDFYLDGMLAALNAFVATLVGFHSAGVDIDDVSAQAVLWAAEVTAWDTTTLWEAFIDAANTKLTATLLDTTAIAAEAEAASTILQDDLELTSLARFEAGMRNINAVQSSAFVIGSAMLQSVKDKQVAKLTADLTLDSWSVKNQGVLEFGKVGLNADIQAIDARAKLTTQLMQFYCQGEEFKRLVTNSIVEALRISIVAKKEETDKQIEIDRAYAQWRWDLLQYVINLLAAGHGGGGSAVGASGPGATQSAIGGTMSGAAAGAGIGLMVGGPAGAATGAVIGGAVGLVGGLLS